MNKNIVCGIYSITSPSGKIYIGESKNILKRWKDYKFLNCKRQVKIYNSLKKYGLESHIFKILEECDFDKLKERERYWQDHYISLGFKLGVNLLNLKLTPTKELKSEMSKKTKEKISSSLKKNTYKRTPVVFTEEMRKRHSERMKGNTISNKGKGFLGKKHTDEWKEFISSTNKNKTYALGKGKVIQQYSLDNKLIREATINVFIKENFNRIHIYNCCTNKRKKHKNFIWKYKSD